MSPVAAASDRPISARPSACGTLGPDPTRPPLHGSGLRGFQLLHNFYFYLHQRTPFVRIRLRWADIGSPFGRQHRQGGGRGFRTSNRQKRAIVNVSATFETHACTIHAMSGQYRACVLQSTISPIHRTSSPLALSLNG